ncbi:MAG: sulfatase [Thermoanaerobaculia bacterium]
MDSSGLLWMGVIALLVGLPAHLMNLEPGGRHTTLGASRNQDKIPIGSPTSTEAIPSPATRWNVVLISIDTLRPDRLGAYGYDRAISPNTDRFAEGGVLFSRAYSTAPWTLPAHMSMITGLLPSMHGAQLSPVFTKKTEILSDDKTTLAEVLSYNNYRTAVFTGGSFLGRDFGFQQGFDELKTGGCLADLWEEARRWLESGSDQPFFLFLHTYEVHNYEPSPEFEEKWVRPIDSESARRLDDRNRLRQFILTSGFFNLNDEELTFISDLYDATIAEADHVLGDIWQYLDEENLSERTVVVLTSDHGEEFFEHGGTGHGFTFYEEMLRIPWILRVPGGPTGVKVDQPVQLIDMMPTILDLLGLAGPAGMQGVSLREVFQGERSGLLTERALIAEASHLGNARSLIHQDTKVIRSKYLPVELSSLDRLLFNLRQLLTRSDDLFFDVAQDPRELRPLEPADLDQGQELLDLLQAHESIADEGGASNPAVEGLSPESIEDLKALGYLQ